MSKGEGATLKAWGVIIGVLSIADIPISNPADFFGDKASAAIPNIPPTLTAGAAPTDVSTADSAADIGAAIDSILAQTVLAARLTK